MAPNNTKQRTRKWPWRLSVAVGVLAAAALAFMNFLGGAFACAWDTSYCATSRDDLGAFRGTITDSGGRPVANAVFHFRDVTLADGDKGPVFESDPDGRYCVMWPVGSTRPFVEPLVPGLRSSLVEQDSTGTAATGDCQTTEQRGQWHRYRDLTSTWQYALLMILPFSSALAFGGAGLLRTHDWRRARQLVLVGALLLSLNLVMYLLLWSA